METTQAQTWDQKQLKSRKRPLKTKTPEIYFGRFYIDCYHFYQQYKDYFKTLGAIEMNCTPFAASFFCGNVSFGQAQHKLHHKSTISITWPELKIFFRKNFENSQAFINNIQSKFKKDFQYQLEETRDYASHFQKFQSILGEFSTVGVFNKPIIIYYF